MFHAYRTKTTVTGYIGSDFINKLKPDILAVFEKKHGHKNIIKAFTKKKLFEQIEKHDVHSKYASLFGAWSECFMWVLKDEGVDSSDFLINNENKKLEDLFNSLNPTELSIAKSIKKYKHKTSHYSKNNIKLSQILDPEKDVKKECWISDLLNVHCAFFKNIVLHFKDKVFPHTANFVNQNDLMKSDICKNIHECNIHGWEFDFYDKKNQMIGDFKFQQQQFSISWFWQLLLYVYVLDFYYQVKAKGIKIINTFFGVEYSVTLNDLFGEEGIVDFFKICKKEIPDEAKSDFYKQTKLCYQHFCFKKPVTDEMISRIYATQENHEIQKIKEFVENLFNSFQDSDIKNVETNIRSIDWVWSKWTEWEEEYVQKS